jgi:hypothetical protein
MSAALDVLRSALAFVARMRWQVLVSAIAFATFALPTQVHEIYRIHVEEQVFWPNGSLLVSGLALLAFTLRNNVLLGLDRGAPIEGRWVITILSAALPIFPSLGALVGSTLAMPYTTEDHWSHRGLNTLRFSVLIECLLLAFWFLREAVFEDVKIRRRQWLRIVTSLLSLFLSAPFFLGMNNVASVYGTLTVATTFFVLLSCILSFMTSLAIAWRLPVVGLAIAFSALVSALDLNNNHDIRLVPATSRPLDAQTAFADWLGSRADYRAFEAQGRRYPVFIVLAEGGGIYAANHAALFLSRVQDVCPSFSQHLFLISSVSGGSLGAGIFAGIARDHARNAQAARCKESWQFPGPFEVAARRALANDFLSPVVAAAVFPDFLQYFLPFSVAAFDRAKAAEASYEALWADESGMANPMKADFLSLWSPEGATPALLLNVTRVESGNRSEISHIEMGDGFFSNGLMQDQINGGLLYSVRLSTAIGLSARFPWLMPSGRLNPALPAGVQAIGTENFVDGGYYDNSGADAVIELLDQISSLPEFRRIDLRVIILKSVAARDTYAYGFEIRMPIRTVLQSRNGRSNAAEDRLLKILCPTRDFCDDIEPDDQVFWFSHLENDEYDLPLGWLFSRASTERVSLLIGRPQDCLADVRSDSGCLLYRIAGLLDPANRPQR